METENNPPIINIEDVAKSYFESKSNQEDIPIQLNPQTNIRYYNLEILFNIFYPEDSLNIAKDYSKKEREEKKILDTSLTYSETVCKIIFIIISHLEQ